VPLSPVFCVAYIIFYNRLSLPSPLKNVTALSSPAIKLASRWLSLLMPSASHISVSIRSSGKKPLIARYELAAAFLFITDTSQPPLSAKPLS
jgi:hypothetical protein